MLANIRRVFQLVNVPSARALEWPESEIGLPVFEISADLRFPYSPFWLSGIQSDQRHILIPVYFRPYRKGGFSMFDSLADRIKQDERQDIPPKERYLRWALITVLSVVLFGSLYYAVRSMG